MYSLVKTIYKVIIHMLHSDLGLFILCLLMLLLIVIFYPEE